MPPDQKIERFDKSLYTIELKYVASIIMYLLILDYVSIIVN